MYVHILPGKRFYHFFVHNDTACEAQKCAKGIFEAAFSYLVQCTLKHQHELKFIIANVNADNGLVPWLLSGRVGVGLLPG